MNKTIAILAVAASLVACSRAPQESLYSVQVPKGFNFRAVRTVQINLHASASLGLDGPAALQLLTPSGGVLYRGGITPTGTLQIPLAVASAFDTLKVELTPGGSGAQARSYTPDPGRASKISVC